MSARNCWPCEDPPRPQRCGPGQAAGGLRLQHHLTIPAAGAERVSRSRSRTARCVSAAAPVLHRSGPIAATCSSQASAMSSAAGCSSLRASWLKSRARRATGPGPCSSGHAASRHQRVAAPLSSCCSGSSRSWSSDSTVATWGCGSWSPARTTPALTGAVFPNVARSAAPVLNFLSASNACESDQSDQRSQFVHLFHGVPYVNQ